jgi:hypothetical protein
LVSRGHQEDDVMTRPPRIALVMPEPHKTIYAETAALMGIPMSVFIAQMLVEASPTIKAMQEPLKTALAGKKEALNQLSGLMDDVKQEATEHQLDILDTNNNGNRT